MLILTFQIKMLTEGTEGAGVLKGKWEGKDQAYVVTAYFTIVDQGEDGVEGAPVYLKGRSVTIGEYDFVPDHPERISIKFKGRRPKLCAYLGCRVVQLGCPAF